MRIEPAATRSPNRSRRRADVLDAVEQRHDEPGVGAHALERRVERRRLDGDDEHVDRLLEHGHGERRRREPAEADALHAQPVAGDERRGLLARDDGHRRARARQRAREEPADAARPEDGDARH